MEQYTAIIRQYFDALLKGDLQTAGNLFADDIIWHQPGNGILSGTKNGKGEVFALLGRFMELSNGTFAIDKIDYIASNGPLVVASIHFRAMANGRSIAMRGIDMMRVENNKIKEMWLFSEDSKSEDAFWTALSEE